MKNRFVLIDLLRLISFLSIVIFHTYSAIYYKEMDQEFWRGKILYWMQSIPRTFSFSGFTIVAIFAFLRGWNGPKAIHTLLWLFLTGIFVLFLTYSSLFEGDYFWEWDIYHYLFVVALSLLAIERMQRVQPRSILLFGVLGFLLTWIPFWRMPEAQSLPLVLQHALVGVCDASGRGGWPLLPWIGLPWAILALGAQVKGRNGKSLFRGEIFLWCALLLLSTPQLGAYYQVLVGPQFYCFTLRQAPLVFWSHFVWIVFCLRWAVHPALQSTLQKNALLGQISKLYLSKYFGQAYLMHLVLIWIFEDQQSFFLNHLWAFDLAYLGALPFLEFSLRLWVNRALPFICRRRYRSARPQDASVSTGTNQTDSGKTKE